MRLLELGYELPKNWREATISDVTSKVGSGATPRGGSSVYTNNGIPLVRSQNVLDNSFTNAGLAFLSDQSASSLKNVELRANDVLLNITGDSILRCCLLPDVMIGGRVNQHVAIIRASDAVIPLYLQKWLVQDWFKDFMLSHSAGATRKAITKGQILSFPIALPPLPEQRRIAGLLGTLDDKIESNRQVCSLIDLLATELFCDRFTVHTRGGTSGLTTIGDVGEIVGGGTPSKKVEEYYADSGIAWLTPRDLSKDRSIFRQHGEFDISELGLRKSSARLLPRGTVLFTSRAPIGYIAIASGETSTNQGFKSIVPHSNFGTPFTFYLLKQLTPEIVTSANGSTFKEISKSGLAKVSFKSPSAEAVEAFNATVQPLLDLQEVKEIENCQLSQLRDTLLPELMSGRMRVDEAGRLVTEALDEEAH